jgi:hypothetical protein
LPLQSLTKAATSPSRKARASASRLSGAGDCEQPAKLRNPKAKHIDEWRFIFPGLYTVTAERMRKWKKSARRSVSIAGG